MRILELSVLLVSVVVALAAERVLHRRNLRRIRIRIHVNGTRGKSSVTRLLAAALREAGIVTCAKTTGTLARMILPDGREVPIFRPAGANVIEQRRIVDAAAAYGAEALVIECMALRPELQVLSELELVRATHGVITNARPDHLDVMGPGEEDVARALAGMTPIGAKLFTAEQRHLEVLRAAVSDRGSELVAVGEPEIAAVAPEELAGFSYREHPDNVALALSVLADLGVARDVALRGMWKAKPDPGALTVHRLDFFGRRIVFFNAFAANDPVSTAQLWNGACAAEPEIGARIAIFNCRADRPDRSLQLGADFVSWERADYVVLMGTGTHLFARAAIAAGFDSARIVFVEDLRVDEIFERIVALIGGSAVVMGMGNIGGQGLDLVRYFANRAVVAEAA
ncbi:MAG: poly-gamma-glutamate synthase PgsB [Polyangiaceae bacterium]|nr:poly-gamma-glutamate synthase PgsB [Polyangiaceae bacterium]